MDTIVLYCFSNLKPKPFVEVDSSVIVDLHMKVSSIESKKYKEKLNRVEWIYLLYLWMFFTEVDDILKEISTYFKLRKSVGGEDMIRIGVRR